MPDEKQLIDICLNSGANDARVLPAEKLPFDRSLRAYCVANSCGNYGRNYACPPAVGEPDALIEQAQSYKYALFFQTIGTLEDSFDIEGMDEAAKRHNSISAEIFKAAIPLVGRHLPLTAGGCSICPVCAIQTGEPCRFPDRAFSSLEAYCMHVSKLCGRCGMKYVNGANTVTYFGMLLFD